MTEQEIKNQIEQHRKAGDLIDWAAKIRVQDGKDAFEKIEKFLYLSENEEEELKSKRRYLADELCDEHKKANDWKVWLENVCATDGLMGDYVKTKFGDEFKQIYSEEIPLHREQGDLIDYLWEELDKYCYYVHGFCTEDLIENTLNGITLFDYDEFSIEHNIIHPLLLESEQIEICKFMHLHLDIKCEDLEDLEYLDTTGEHFKMLLDLYTSAPDSIEYKRFQKLRKCVSNAEAGRRLDFTP